ncbi:ABC-2 type transport system permease protein [Mucilaginibacter frigoritolerans]|uniref:Transport permease protein n=1 Tax=Mucilaginibacter frigoritolerans TaxID=652788 RepID=A0A562UF73_9SPHI|nr:ABC transporter permease [Mucilaginibacter frigoritolerans]TWJ04438.1 ABC-2 type transport system permease protein [Mucilaginibacter frigoritolerans]
MKKPYSNFNATMAIAVASFRSIIRSPSAVVFSLAFPLIFIIVFANIGGSSVTVDVGVAKTTDTLNPVYKILANTKVINLIKDQSTDEMAKNLSKGKIDAIIDIQKNNSRPPFTLHIQYTKASQPKDAILKSLLNSVFYQLNSQGGTAPQPVAEIKETTVSGREYKYIDFLLPGMLGFSLLSSGVFGTAFVFLSLRLTLVIKRFFATPVKKYSIVLGEALARLIFSWIGALFIILVGHYAFGFTLVHGFTTVVNMLILSAIGLIVFMGFGFIISGIAKNESTVPPLSNIITLPQFLLSGTFFATTAFPSWLQGLSNILPLTYLNKAMRDVAFEGAGLGDVTHDLLILGIWFIIVYAVAVKTFKWE